MAYNIVRYRFKAPSEIIEEGLTLEEAQEHCNSQHSHGLNWFDGYTSNGEDEDDE